MTCQILVVDDEPDIEMLLCQKFRREIRQKKYVFTFVGDGAQAYEKVTEAVGGDAAVEVVLTDINMPVMDGLELLGKLNALPEPPKTVVVSAYGDMDNIRAAMNSGAFDFLTKPLNFQDLVMTLDKTLKVVAEGKTQRARLEQAQVQLVQSEKMSSLGQMLAGVAHEMNNPVNFLAGNLEPAKDYMQDVLHLVKLYQKHVPEPAAEIQDWINAVDLDFLMADLAKLFMSLEMGTTLIRELALSLRNFSRLDNGKKQPVNLHDGIKSTLVILNSRLKATGNRPTIKVIREYESLPDVSCHPSQINQVVMNLMGNAIDALEEQNQGKTYQEIEAAPNIIRISTAVVDENWVRLAIADNGPGMDVATATRLFDPFFTTKPVDKGTGLGLAISQQIIEEKHGGRLSCESVLGEGTQFVIEIPIDMPD